MEPILYISAVICFAAAAILGRIFIPVLKSIKMGQKILDIGPRWHKSKEGTPTMGGIAFLVASVLVGIAAIVSISLRGSFRDALPLTLTLAYALLNGMIGIIDDAAKLRHKQNEGLTAGQKYILQFLAAALYLVAMIRFCGLSTTLCIPFAGTSVDLGWGYYVLAMLLLTGIVNSVNLTDGIDGLCSSVTLIVGVFFSLAGFLILQNDGLSVIGALLIGSAAGFLVYNFYPARVFMGDTGSLFFGGLVVGGAFLTGSPLVVVLCGIVYIVETLSVILQVLYFKLTHGKRLFRMSPIHHHFEKCGWTEIKIVIIFSLITALGCAGAYFSLL